MFKIVVTNIKSSLVIKTLYYQDEDQAKTQVKVLTDQKFYDFPVQMQVIQMTYKECRDLAYKDIEGLRLDAVISFIIDNDSTKINTYKKLKSAIDLQYPAP